MSKTKTDWLAGRLEQIGGAASFSPRVIADVFRAPFEMNYVLEETADQGYRSLPLTAACKAASKSISKALAPCHRTEYLRPASMRKSGAEFVSRCRRSAPDSACLTSLTRSN